METFDDISWHLMTFWLKITSFIMICHDISWHVMIWPLLIQRGRAVVANGSSLSTVEPTGLWQSRLSRQGGPHLSKPFYRIKTKFLPFFLGFVSTGQKVCQQSQFSWLSRRSVDNSSNKTGTLMIPITGLVQAFTAYDLYLNYETSHYGCSNSSVFM